MSRSSFLTRDADEATLRRAVAANHVDWLAGNARAGGGVVMRVPGLTWLHDPEPHGTSGIFFPRLPLARARAALDRALDDLRARHRGPEQIGCWALEPDRPRWLAALLFARGFQPGWQPHWMALDLRALRDEFRAPPELDVRTDDGPDPLPEGLPYRKSPARTTALVGMRPRRSWRFLARLDGEVVGVAWVHLGPDRLAVAGLYDVGVLPAVRNRGIGKAVTAAACRLAASLGCRYATLNSSPAGEPVYTRLGFRSLGRGNTWWLPAARLASPPESRSVAFAEAVGLGDVAALERLAAADAVDPSWPLPCGMTPVELAAVTRQPRAAEWLVARGAELDPISAWDLGWKDRLPVLLARRPELASCRYGEIGMTPLHFAAERGDVELARVLLAAGADPEARDFRFDSTPWGWARHFGRTEIAELIERHVDGSKA